MKRAVFLFYPFISAFGGIERLIIDLWSVWKDHSIDLQLVCFNNQVDFGKYGVPSIAIHNLKASRHFWPETKVLREFANTKSISAKDFFVWEMRGAMYAGCALEDGYSLHIADPPSLLPRDITKLSYSISDNSSLQMQRPSILRRIRGEIVHRLTRRGVRKASTRLTMTRRNRDELGRIYGLHFDYVYPGIRRNAEFTSDQRKDADVTFLSVCRLEKSKRVDAIIRAFSHFSTKTTTSNDRLVIVGEGSERSALEQLTSQLNMVDKIAFLGHVDEVSLQKIYKSSDVFVMPAKQGYGLPGLESLDQGLRLIVHEESGVSEFLRAYSDVIIINDHDETLASAMDGTADSVRKYGRRRITVQSREQWALEIGEKCGWL